MQIDRTFLKDFFYESNGIEDIWGNTEILQSIGAWNSIKNADNITHGLICHAQKMITKNQIDLKYSQRGYYRDLSKTNVTIGGQLAPHYAMVPHLMENWLLDFKDAKTHKDIWKGHRRFEQVHPFADGNGRTGRIIMLWQEVKAGLEPTVFRAKEKYQYYYPLFGDY